MLLSMSSQITQFLIGHLENVLISELPAELIENLIDELHVVLYWCISTKEARAWRKSISSGERRSVASLPQ